MYALLDKVYKLCLPVDISLELFDQLVLPVLLYGCEVILVTLPTLKFYTENMQRYYWALHVLLLVLWVTIPIINHGM